MILEFHIKVAGPDQIVQRAPHVALEDYLRKKAAAVEGQLVPQQLFRLILGHRPLFPQPGTDLLRSPELVIHVPVHQICDLRPHAPKKGNFTMTIYSGNWLYLLPRLNKNISLFN